MKQYDEYTIREAMHNAIAHQDYTLLTIALYRYHT